MAEVRHTPCPPHDRRGTARDELEIDRNAAETVGHPLLLTDKGTPAARPVRKATGLPETAGLPKKRAFLLATVADRDPVS
jgi:hypothetical protein